MRAFYVLLALSLLGCLSERDQILRDKACDDDDGCVDGFVCRANICFLAAEAPDLDGGPDAGRELLCLLGETRCSQNVPQTCDDNGEFVDGTPCPNICVEGVCAGACEPGATLCAGRELLTCDVDGQFPAAGDLCQFACTNGACSGVCVPGEIRCDGLVPQTCDAAGQQVDGTQCPDACLGGLCVGCDPTSQRCNGTDLETCDNGGVFNLEESCPFICDDVGLACAGECVPDDTVCNGNTERTCQSNGLFTDVTCPFVCNANNGQCDGECVPTTVSCVGDLPQTCGGDGFQVAGTTCAGGTPFCDTGVCVSPVVNGFPVPFANEAALSENFLFARRIPVTTGTAATSLAMIVTANAGSEVVMGLYANAGGVPGDLLASTAPTTTVLGAQELPLASEVPIPPGDYWIVVSFSVNTSVGWANDGVLTTTHFTARTHDGTLPTPFLSENNVNVENYNFWIVARP